MMFLILFGSLAAAMAIASQGNVRTSATHLHVLRAMGAAETGLLIGQATLEEAVASFVVDRGKIDEAFGKALWSGSLSGFGEIEVLPLRDGTVPVNVSDAVIQIHLRDHNTVSTNGTTSPAIGSAPSGVSASEYRLDGWVVTPAVGLDEQPNTNGLTPAEDAIGTAYQITYAPLANGTDVRVIVTGYDFAHRTNGVPLTRTITQDFRMVKRVSQAVVSPNRIMIGKNVLITGALGSTYEDVQEENGNPVTLKSDFRGLHTELDQKIDIFISKLSQYDVDGDNRLRTDHPVEKLGLPYDNTGGNGAPNATFGDVTQDGYVDDFDLFLNQFDANGDGKVALSDDLRAGTPGSGLTAEFIGGGGEPIDDDLALLLDAANPDRNRNGVSGFQDLDNDGVWDPGEPLLDYDDYHGQYADQVLGYRDGVLDYKDQYAKVRGRLAFRVGHNEWEDAQGDLNSILQGAIRPARDEAAQTYDASESQLPDLTPDRFTVSQGALQAAVIGASPFEDQVAANLGISASLLPTYVETGSDPQAPQYYRLDPDANGDGLPDNHLDAYFEKMPFASPNHSDYYYRPVYKNMLFKDVEIPMGINGLFVNCTFVGVTYVRSYTNNMHDNWALYGKMELSPEDDFPRPAVPRVPYTNAAQYPDDVLPASALPPEQGYFIPQDPITQALDKADFPKDERPLNFNDLPDPLIIGGKRVVDTKLFSNNIRFHDCLFIGSVISDTPQQYRHVRNKLQFTGATRFVQEHPDPAKSSDPQYQPDPGDLEAIETSSLMAPNYSVDIGSFNSPPEQDVRLRGAVIAGVLDIRGNATIDGALLMTFKPIAGEGPLKDLFGNPIGSTAGFNTTIGYFGPDDGDGESLDPNELTVYNGQKIVGWDLDGDGIADLPHDATPTPEQLAAGATPVPFYGYGRIDIRFNPSMALPDGIMLPVQIDRLVATYSEGRIQ